MWKAEQWDNYLINLIQIVFQHQIMKNYIDWLLYLFWPVALPSTYFYLLRALINQISIFSYLPHLLNSSCFSTQSHEKQVSFKHFTNLGPYCSAFFGPFCPQEGFFNWFWDFFSNLFTVTLGVKILNLIGMKDWLPSWSCLIQEIFNYGGKCFAKSLCWDVSDNSTTEWYSKLTKGQLWVILVPGSKHKSFGHETKKRLKLGGKQGMEIYTTITYAT